MFPVLPLRGLTRPLRKKQLTPVMAVALRPRLGMGQSGEQWGPEAEPSLSVCGRGPCSLIAPALPFHPLPWRPGTQLRAGRGKGGRATAGAVWELRGPWLGWGLSRPPRPPPSQSRAIRSAPGSPQADVREKEASPLFTHCYSQQE